jgi:hypothetical protein
MQSNVRDGVLFRSPKDEAERAYVAGACVRKLGIKFPALIDRACRARSTVPMDTSRALAISFDLGFVVRHRHPPHAPKLLAI